MPVEMKLKAKYTRHKPVSGYKSKHNNGAKRVKRDGARAGFAPPYVRENHVLVLLLGRKQIWRHTR